MNDRVRFETVLANKEFVVTAEVGPPKNAAGTSVRDKAARLKGFVHALNVTDCQSAVVRLSSLASAVHVQDAGVEAVFQLTCRDRNRIALQSDLLGAASLGITNVLCLTGDHQCFGNHPQAKNVFDLDSIQFVEMVRGLSSGRFQCGEEIKGAVPRFVVGAVENLTALPVEARLMRLYKKIRAGARFIQTQGVFEVSAFTAAMGMAAESGLLSDCRLLAGVIPLRSARVARFMTQRVPGIQVPEAVIQRMEQAADPESEGIRIAVETIEALRDIPGVSGIHLMAVGWEDAVPAIVEQAGIRPNIN